MKKLLTIFIISALVLVSLSACSKSKQRTQPVNGIFIIGDEQYALSIFDRYKENIKEKDMFRVKIGKFNEKKVLILDESTAQALIKSKIFHKRDDVNGNMDSTPLAKLPKIPKGSSLLFAYEDESHITSIDLNGKTIPVTYDSNSWLGSSRDYDSEWYLIVTENNEYKAIQADETNLQLIDLKKSLGDQKPTMSTDNTVVNEYLKMKKQVKDFDKLISVKFVTFEDKK
ncbi:lipoprotein BA_5634 family protein [Bacillus sp. DX4.1]|uniref:lipoprotein BA_5634 family protein n=1 Tax=Bacillus sp. DX4.1 TaxID=3055867 RepID=UPI0025A14EB5|nr:lipoprotein BA_5634 family protein [Bacillus sp. DX4.1]MDM5188887.1 lipoprotein BA_5634 family protein [Bacillus sp. DX4.1]